MDWPILIKFGTEMQPGPPDPLSQLNFNILKIQDGDDHHFENKKLQNALSMVTNGRRHNFIHRKRP